MLDQKAYISLLYATVKKRQKRILHYFSGLLVIISFSVFLWCFAEKNTRNHLRESEIHPIQLSLLFALKD
jgi:TRAP-type C4-dicarboxylate transport system permease small subunit